MPPIVFAVGSFPDSADNGGVKRIEKTSTIQLAADAMKKEIAAGTWQGRLPGARVLANRLGVSPPTMAAAMAKLMEAGILEGGGERKAFRVARKRSGKPKPTEADGTKRLLILAHDDLNRLVDITRRVVEMLREHMTRKGWIVDMQVVDFLHVKHMQRSWDKIIDVDPNTSVIAIYGRDPLAAWAAKRKIRMLFLGGSTGAHPVSMVAVKSSSMAADALAKLTALGHTRIVIPLCDRTAVFKDGMRQVTQRAIEDTGGVYVKNYHNPESDYLTPDVTWRILDSVFTKQAPTAFVLLDWKELITVHCYLSQRGMKVPDDVSLVLLNDTVEAEWFHPKLARFRFPVRRLAGEMAKWLEGDKTTVSHVSLAADYVDGLSIQAPPKSASKS
jgi:DNA-binding transcriptional regulator YhcF (GntR family)